MTEERWDRLIIGAGVLGITAVGWAWLVHDAQAGQCARMMMAGTARWSVGDLALIFLMWDIMMVAMMLPSISPTLLVVARLNRQRQSRSAPYTPTAVFLSGYLLVWTAFSGIATVLQAWMQQTALVSNMMASTSLWLSGILLLLAGAFQWTPLKNRCLSACHTPWSVLSTGWREGYWGALRMGINHGTYCVGCCWAVMLLLFVAGVMNLVWIAALSLFVLVEKLLPKPARYSGGVLMIGTGLWTIVTAAQ
jgi:predicted metal-binding membrane protein